MKFKLLIGIVISAFFLFLAFHSVNFSELFIKLQQTNYWYIFPSILVLYFTIYLRAVRWQYLLNPVKEKIKISNLFSAMSIGLMANSVLPARAGEFVFAIVIGMKERISKTSAFATVVVSRLFDGIALFLLLLLLLTFYPFENPKLHMLKYIVVVIYSIAIIGLVLLYYMQEKVFDILRKIFFFLPERIINKLISFLESFISGLHFIRDFKGVLLVFLFSIIIWVMVGFSYLPIVYAFPFNYDLPFYAPFFILAIVAFGVMIPSSPGFVGTFHGFCVFAMSLIAPQISKDSAGGFAIVLHASQIIPMIILGLILLWKEGLSWQKLSNQSEEVELAK